MEREGYSILVDANASVEFNRDRWTVLLAAAQILLGPLSRRRKTAKNTKFN